MSLQAISYKLQIIFFGTPDFAVLNLQSLLDEPTFKVTTVVTQPDKKVGRKQILTPPPVKVLAQQNKIPVLQPEKANEAEFAQEIKHLNPDVIVVAAYGQILPKEILELPRLDCINVHASLLPKYRGASPIQAAILNGEAETGITYMLMDEGLDTGDILETVKVPISTTETGESLFKKLAQTNHFRLPQVIKDWAGNKINPQKQDDKKATYTKTLRREDGRIVWNQLSARKVERQIRAYDPWPGNFSYWDKKRVKILAAVSTSNAKKTLHAPGTVFTTVGNNLCVQCKEGHIKITNLQLEGKRPLSSQEFLNGHPEFVGTALV